MAKSHQRDRRSIKWQLLSDESLHQIESVAKSLTQNVARKRKYKRRSKNRPCYAAEAARVRAASADVLAQRFQKEIKAKRLSAKIPANVRGRILIDMMQGLLLRARAGIPREELLRDARS